MFWMALNRPLRFLSTLSLRRATLSCAWSASKLGDFYPRSPCGERLHYDNYNLHCVEISIHALLAESDHVINTRAKTINRFLSTLSLRRATNPVFAVTSEVSISIHALLAESDITRIKVCIDNADFYPRSPCGERRRCFRGLQNRSGFLSTLSLRRATHSRRSRKQHHQHFYPRSPCGERPMMQSMVAILILFLSTLSLRRATPITLRHCTTYLFLSTLSLRRATQNPGKHYVAFRFLSTLSLRRATFALSHSL